MVDGAVVVAAGDSVYGAWEISAQRQPGGELPTRIKLTEPDGGVLWLGGSDGPAAWPGRVLNVGSGGQGAGPCNKPRQTAPGEHHRRPVALAGKAMAAKSR